MYIFVQNYIYTHKDYTKDLQVIRGQHCFLLSSFRMTSSPCIVSLCCYDEDSFVAPPMSYIEDVLVPKLLQYLAING
jgi:hypothetical protein